MPRPGVEPGIFRFSFNLSLIAVPLTTRQPRPLHLLLFGSILVNIILNSLLIDSNTDLYSSVLATVSMSQEVTKKSSRIFKISILFWVTSSSLDYLPLLENHGPETSNDLLQLNILRG